MITEKLNYLELVTKLRRIVQSTIILRGLYDYSEAEWMRSYNVESDDHLIKGVFTSAEKTDCIRAYVAKLAKMYLNSVGVVPGGWTKATLTAENTFTKHTIDRLATTELKTNKELFLIVCTRIFGADETLVRATWFDNDSALKRSEKWVTYLANTTDETVDPEVVYSGVVHALTALSNLGKLDDTFFDYLVVKGIEIFSGSDEDTYKEIDPMDMLDTAVSQVLREIPEYKEVQSAVNRLYVALSESGE